MQNPFEQLPSLPTMEEETYEEHVNNSPNAGNNSALEQGSMTPQGWKPTLDKPLPVVRCTSTVRNGVREGQRCGRWSIAGAKVCLVHGGQIPNVREAAAKRVEAAKLRLIDDADLAIDTLFELLKPGTAAQVQLGAANSILDRAGVKSGVELSVEVTHAVSASDTIADKLKSMAARMAPPEELEELEVVEEEVDNE